MEVCEMSNKEINIFNDLLAVPEASVMYGTSVSTIKRKIREGEIIEGIDCKNYGKQWVVTKDALNRVFGKPVKKLTVSE